MRARLLAVPVCCLAFATARCGTSSADAPQGAAASGGAGGGGGADGGGTDGGTASNECDGLSADPNATSIAITAPSEECGIAAISDSSGNVALSSGSDAFTSRSWATYDRSGGRLGTLHSNSPVTPRSSGFFGLDHFSSPDPPSDAYHLWTFAPDGSGPSESVGGFLCRTALHRTSAGGVLLTGTCGSGIRSASRVVWYDDAGAQKWLAWVDAFPVSSAMGDSAGNVLIAASSDAVPGRPAGDLLGRWITPSGSVAGDWFVIVSGNAAPAVLHSKIDGGAAVMQDGKWVAVLPPLGIPQPPPEWLTSRRGQDFQIVRGRKAYAFTSLIVASGSPGGPSVEVVTPSGKSCGTFDTKGFAATVGADGTVVANTDNCTRKMWPGLLGQR